MMKLTTEAVTRFATLPFIQRSLSSPKSPESILSFFLGIDITDESSSKVILQNGSYTSTMSQFWFSGNSDYDALFQPFVPIIRDAGNHKLIDDDDHKSWNTIDGKLSRLLLCDQFSRNCFRGTDEAFAYDHIALDIARELSHSFLVENDVDFYASYAYFLTLTFMHSEEINDHRLGKQVLDKGRIGCPTIQWDMTESFLKDHTAVIEKFGRYPHRNVKIGREATIEEEEWLNSPNVPMWARSQH